jgi:D-alanyl-D-alanine carboxypeptidase
MKRRLLSPFFQALVWTLLCAVLLQGASNALTYRSFPPSWQTTLDRFTETGAIPGAVVILRSPEWGVRVGVTGFADLKTRRKASPDLPFRVGSVTKVFTGQLILILEQQGRLKLTDPILKHLGDNAAVAAIPNIDKITIGDCMQMKAGVTNYLAYPAIASSPDTSPRKQYTPEELLAPLNPATSGALAPDFAPGATYPNPYWVAFMGPLEPPTADYPPYPWWNYSNSNYIVLGLVVEKVSGMSIAEAVQALICQRLGMDDTLFATDMQYPSAMVRGYTKLDALRNPKYPDWMDVTDVNPSYAWSAGAVISTPWDLLRLLESVFKTERLLNKGTRQKWLTFVSAAIHWADTQYGMGAVMQVQRTYGDLRGHGGAYPGYKTAMYRFADSDTTLIISANTWDGQPEVDIMDAIMQQATFAPTTPDPSPGQRPSIGWNNSVTVSWQAGRLYGDTYRVYWGTRPDLVEAATVDSHAGVEMKTTKNLMTDLAGLAADTTYYWRVDAVSTATGPIASPVWWFSPNQAVWRAPVPGERANPVRAR